MRVTRVEWIELDVTARGRWTFVRVETDDGHCGIGEVSQSGNDPVARAYLEHAVVPKLVGRDPRRIELLWRELAGLDAPRGARNFVGDTILSGIEQALWDLRARSLGVPVCELFGGRLRECVPVYANLNRATWDRSPAGFAAAARQAVADGFTRVKCTPFDDVYFGALDRSSLTEHVDAGLARVAAVREVVGSDVALMVDCHERFDLPLARQVLRELVAYDPAWIEEPLPTHDIDGLAALRAQSASHTPLAGGELLFGRAQYKPYLERRLFDVVMPDVKHCGGLWEAYKIGSMAEVYGVAVSPHNPSGPVSTAVSLHLAASLANAGWLEVAWGEVSWRHTLTSHSEELFNGCMRVPETPGLGVELVDEVVERQRIC